MINFVLNLIHKLVIHFGVKFIKNFVVNIIGNFVGYFVDNLQIYYTMINITDKLYSSINMHLHTKFNNQVNSQLDIVPYWQLSNQLYNKIWNQVFEQLDFRLSNLLKND